MAQPYLTDLQALVERLGIDNRADIECRHFFSGAAAYVEGAIFMSLSSAGLALKLPQDECARLLNEGGKPLQYFPNAPVKKDYVVLPDELVDDDDALRDHISNSASFVAGAA